jgi:hypothetical protein
MRHHHLLLLSAILFFSCKKDLQKQSFGNEIKNETELKKTFGIALAKSLQSEPQLREFIKQESLKQFDRDYDVLFQAVKESKINGSKTFYEILMENATDKQSLNFAINNLPLLTIFVPTVPNFSPLSWTPIDQVPAVAIEPDNSISNKQEITMFDAIGNETLIPYGQVPGFAVLVIKNNERVVVNGSKYDLSKQYINTKDEKVSYLTIDGLKYSFTSKAFDGISGSSLRQGFNYPGNGTYTIDKINVDAYYSGVEWHRDYIYFGIDPSNGINDGIYRNNYHEFVKSFKFTNKDDYFSVSDEPNDPTFNRFKNISEYGWTEGNYEFYVDIIINAKNGTGSILHKAFTCKGSDLFEPDWKPIFPGSVKYYTTSIKTAKEYNPNLDLIPWDLENYGNAWKFIVLEYDVSATTTKVIQHNSTFGANFEISPTLGKKKIGAKFGLSATTSTTTTNTYAYTTGSDELGEGIIAFDYKVITDIIHPPTQTFSEYYYTYEVSTGRVSFSVEPTKVW